MAELAPQPPADLTSPVAITAWHWDAGRLAFPATGQGDPVWPPRLAAPGTGAPLTWHVSAGLGTVYAATALHARDADPRSVVLIDLDEGVRMLSRVEGIGAADVRPGLRVTARFTEPDAAGSRIPVFVPADAS
jgi:uncharacterized OB-fold protein